MRLSPLSILALMAAAGLSACATEPAVPSEITGDQATAPVFQGVDGEALAEQATWEHVAASGRLNQVDGLELTELTIDPRGMAHSRMQQLHGGVPVFGGEAILHLQANGTFSSLSDNLVYGLTVDPTAAYSAAEAADFALALEGVAHDPSDDLAADLWVLDSGKAGGALVWRVQLRDTLSATPSMMVVFIDAHTGIERARYDDLQTYSLSDSDKRTYDMRNSTRYSRARVGDSSDGDLLTTHDAVADTLAFLSTSQGRDSYDGNGAVVNSYGHYSRSYVNAFWDGRRLTFGDGDGYYSNYLGVLDVTAHELGHALTDAEANLTYSYESGALNEAASDILAAAVEASVDGAVNADTWDVGEDCWVEPGTTALRYMASPSDDGSSYDHYSARYTGSSDNGGVHWNSGIANHWFYLLTSGGQHHNSAYRSGYTVAALGIDVAWDIWYEALTNYMTSSTDFAGARTATESACAALGYTTTECESVSYAWFEVGVGADPLGGGGGTGGGGTGGGVGTGGGGTGGTTSACVGSEVSYLGSLTGTGDQAVEPNGTYASYSSPTGSLTGPSGTNFDLYLYKWHKKRGWTVADSSTNSGSSESVSSGSNGDHYFIVYSYAGAGAYELCIDG